MIVMLNTRGLIIAKQGKWWFSSTLPHEKYSVESSDFHNLRH